MQDPPVLEQNYEFDPLLAASGRRVIPINFQEGQQKQSYVSNMSKTSPKAGGGFGRMVKAHSTKQSYLAGIGRLSPQQQFAITPTLINTQQQYLRRNQLSPGASFYQRQKPFTTRQLQEKIVQHYMENTSNDIRAQEHAQGGMPSDMTGGMSSARPGIQTEESPSRVTVFENMGQSQRNDTLLLPNRQETGATSTDPKYSTNESFKRQRQAQSPYVLFESKGLGLSSTMISGQDVANVNPALGLQNTALYNAGAGVGFVAKQAYKSSRTELLQRLGYHEVPNTSFPTEQAQKERERLEAAKLYGLAPKFKPKKGGLGTTLQSTPDNRASQGSITRSSSIQPQNKQISSMNISETKFSKSPDPERSSVPQKHSRMNSLLEEHKFKNLSTHTPLTSMHNPSDARMGFATSSEFRESYSSALFPTVGISSQYKRSINSGYKKIIQGAHSSRPSPELSRLFSNKIIAGNPSITFSLGKAEHKFRVNLEQSQRLERKMSQGDMLGEAKIGGSVSEKESIRESMNESVKDTPKATAENPKSIDTAAGRSTQMKITSSSHLSETGAMVMNATALVRKAAETRAERLQRDMNLTTLTGERNQFILRSNQANLAMMRTPKTSLVHQVGNYANPSTKFELANRARKAQLEHGIATDPAALGSSNLFALSALSIPTLADPRIDSQISLMAGVAKAQSSQKVSGKVSSSAKQNMLDNIFAISRDPTQFTLIQATTGRFAEVTTEQKSTKKNKEKARFINFVEDGSDLKNAKFCRLNINSILQKYDIKKAKLKAKIKKINEKRSLSPKPNESQKPQRKHHSLSQSINVSSHRRSYDAASIQSLIRRQEQYQDPIKRRLREQEEQKSQVVMDKQATLEIMDYCSKALSNDVMNDIKLFQALFMLDGTRVFNIKEIPADCAVLVLSEHQNVFQGLHNTGPDISGNEAYALQLRAMFKTVKQRWISQKEEEYMREAQEHFNLNTPELLIQENRTQTSLGFHQRTESPFMFQKHTVARQRKISPIRISKGRITPMRTHYPGEKYPEERVTLPSIEEIPGAADQMPRLTHTSMTPSEPMMAEVVLKQEEKEEKKQSQKRNESVLPVISKRDEKYLNAEARIISHKKKIQMRKNLRSVANLSLPEQPSVLSTSSQSGGIKNLAYAEIKEFTKKYKLQTRDIYDLYSRFRSIKGLYEDVTGGGLDSQEGKEVSLHEEDGVSVLFLMKDSPIFKGKMVHISSRILRALGFDPDNKKAIVTWDKFLYINSLLRYFSLEVEEYVSFWGKFLDPDSFQRIQLKEIRNIFENLARGVYNTEETIISSSCADAIVELIQMSGCVEQERINTTGQKVSKRQTLSTAEYGSQITDYSRQKSNVSRLSSAQHDELKGQEQEKDKYEEYLNISYFKDCLVAGHLDPMVFNHLILDRYDNCFTCIDYNKRVLKNKRREIRKQRRTEAEESEFKDVVEEGQLDLSMLQDIKEMLGDLKLE